MRFKRTISKRSGLARIKVKEVNSVLAYAASLMLTGVTADVCESALTEFYTSVKKSITSIIP